VQGREDWGVAADITGVRVSLLSAGVCIVAVRRVVFEGLDRLETEDWICYLRLRLLKVEVT